MATNNSVKGELANKKNNDAAKQDNTPANTIAAYLKKMGPEFERAMPKHMDADRLSRIALTTIRQNPALLDATIPSLMGAVMQAAQLGLEPGLIGHCYLVPFNNKKKGADGKDYWEKDVQFIMGYKGMIDLARRSGHIKSIYAHTVHENDEFEYELGLEPKLVHKPATGDRGAMEYAYAVAHFTDGGYQFEVFSKHDIDQVKKRSKAGNFGPWKTDYEEMAKKTVVRRMFKYLPISIEIQQHAAQDETVRRDITEEAEKVDNIIDLPNYETPNTIDVPDDEPEEEKPKDKKKPTKEESAEDIALEFE
ncbi:recombination protein RecT [Geomicrobium sp. JCM 19039]|uniref:recombination protein RecT n=1 Tax=Geomicrobium sp. JCM 19039 TaxID=1460636 RepID=UPI00045F4AA2|nr:recombination protein RecT [Geomicrobium sp. JCM 19039]GAK12215.1 recombinational DNA repair protein RecT [Geomicrobium sp. JCM 19039]